MRITLEDQAGSPQEETQKVYDTRLSVQVLFLLTVIVVGFPIATAIIRRLWTYRRRLSGPVWTGGVPYVSQSMQFTGGVLTSLVWQALERKAVPREDQARSEAVLPSRYQLSEGRYIPEFLNAFYNLGVVRLLHASQAIGNWFQNGDIRRYLLYIFWIFIIVLAVLIVLLLFQGG